MVSDLDEEEPTLRDRAREQLPRYVATAESDEDPTAYQRTAASALRLIMSVLGLAVVELLVEALPTAHEGLQDDLQRRAGSWATGLGQLSDAIATGWSVLVLVIAIAAGAMARRPRQMATSIGAAALAGVVVTLAARLGGTTPGEVVASEWQFIVIAAAVAMGAATATVFRTPVARWSTGVIAMFTLVGVLGDDISLASRVMLVLTGEAVGSLVALVFGTASRRVGRSELLHALEQARLPVTDLRRPDVDARGSQPWRGTLATGSDVFVKVEAVDELRATQLFRMWRRIRLRRTEDGRAPSSSRQSAEHEAFVSQRARVAGVRTPGIISIGVLEGDRGVFTVFEALDGTTVDSADEVGDTLLRSAWAQVQVLRRAGIAHRDLRAANLMCLDDEAWLIDFGFAEVAATDEMLDRDIAELVASTSAVVGAERAVDNAVAVLGADTVAAAIPWMQPLAVSNATRAALAKSDFEELRERVRAASGQSAPELPQLQRITWKGVAITAALGIAVWTLLPQLTSGIDWGAALEANRAMIGLAVIGSFATYFGAAVSVAGSVRERVPIVATFFAQLAGSFVNRVTPAKVGALALNVRFLSQQGVDNAVAATGLAVSTAAGTVVHVLITVIVILWAGNVGLPGVSAPPAWVIVVLIAVAVVSLLAVALVPRLRKWWSDSVLPSLRRSLRAFLTVIRSPRNLAMLLGGSAIVTLGNLVAFAVSARAFGIGLSFATLGVVYLAGSALASAAPTPGGLGATEAALVAGLAVVDVPENEAIPAVLLFRLATFWLPILPGWISLVVLQRRGAL